MKTTHYIHLEKINDNNFYYGIMSMLDDKPYDFNLGTIKGERTDVLDTLTRNTLIRQKTPLKPNSFLFKYDNVEDTKYMLFKMMDDKFYTDYEKENDSSFTVSPSVFLSDVEKIKPLFHQLKLYKDRLKFYNHKNNEK